jgi:signal transduction histidine kinase
LVDDIRTIRREYTATDFEVMADRALLEQVFVNLIENAAKALKGVTHRVPMLTIGARVYDKDFVEIEFEDNGIGIEPDNIPRVFLRYFSTYANGTGLGLYYARIIIEEIHKGRIEIRSSWGRGTTVLIRLPVGR